MDFKRPSRSQHERTRQEDRRLKFYGLRDKLAPRPRDDLRQSDEEALTLANAKHRLMARDKARDHESGRLGAKRPVIAAAPRGLREAFALSGASKAILDPKPRSHWARRAGDGDGRCRVAGYNVPNWEEMLAEACPQWHLEGISEMISGP
jgi:hypothetical protein